MMIDYDQKYGPNGQYPWPSCPEVAERFIEAALYAKSSHECLDNDFFFDYLDQLDDHLFYDYPEDEARKMIKANAKSRQQLFKEARKWPLDTLIASATYKICSTKPEGMYMLSRLWHCFFWPFLVFDELLFDMFQAKGWDLMYRDKLRRSFRSLLVTELYDGVTINKLLWGGDTDTGKEKPWFTYPGFARHVYPESVLRCLDLIGIDAGRAHLVVDEVFKLKSLAPLCDVLSNDTFPIDRSKVKKLFHC
jgi:hypothetical protein